MGCCGTFAPATDSATLTERSEGPHSTHSPVLSAEREGFNGKSAPAEPVPARRSTRSDVRAGIGTEGVGVQHGSRERSVLLPAATCHLQFRQAARREQCTVAPMLPSNTSGEVNHSPEIDLHVVEARIDKPADPLRRLPTAPGLPARRLT